MKTPTDKQEEIIRGFFMALGIVNGCLTPNGSLPHILDIIANEPRMLAHLKHSREQMGKLIAQIEADLPSSKQ